MANEIGNPGDALVLLDARGIRLASLTWDGEAFTGFAYRSGTALSWWAHDANGSALIEGELSGLSVCNVFANEKLSVSPRTVGAWLGVNDDTPTVPMTSMPKDKCLRTETMFSEDVVIDGRIFRPSPLRHVMAALSLIPDVGMPAPIDLSPLANLATAVVWGMVLERVVTEWRAWHPAARVSWDTTPDRLRLTYMIEGLGAIGQDPIPLSDNGLRLLNDYALKGAKGAAALAMAPHYIAPTPKPENRDAALRRFADGVTR